MDTVFGDATEHRSRAEEPLGALRGLIPSPCSLNDGWSDYVVLFPAGRELGQADERVDAEVLAH